MSISQKSQSEADSIEKGLKDLERIADYEWVQAFERQYSFSVPLARMLHHPGLYIRTLESEGRYALSEAAYQLQVVIGIAGMNAKALEGSDPEIPYVGVHEAMSIAYHDWRAAELAEFIGVPFSTFRKMTDFEQKDALVKARKAANEHADVSDELIESYIKEGRDAR